MVRDVRSGAATETTLLCSLPPLNRASRYSGVAKHAYMVNQADLTAARDRVLHRSG
jgi:hypothetical protein